MGIACAAEPRPAEHKEQTIVVSYRTRSEGGRPSLLEDGGEGCSLPGLLLFDVWGPEGGTPETTGQQFSACLPKCLSLSIFSKPLRPSGLQASCILSSLMSQCSLSNPACSLLRGSQSPRWPCARCSPAWASFPTPPPISSWAHQKF